MKIEHKEYKCPQCNNLVDIELDGENDVEFGLSITLQVSCSICDDVRLAEWEDATEIIPELLKLIGQ